MLKPDFGSLGKIDWTADRVAWVKHLAEDKRMTAREIATDIGLTSDQAPRIFELCKRCDIVLPGIGGRPKRVAADAAVYTVAVASDNSRLLARLARQYSMTPGRFAEQLLNACLEEGETFCANMLNLETGA